MHPSLKLCGGMQECKSKGDEDQMVLCDWCQQGVHLYCHKPALADVPQLETWYCHQCTPWVEKQKAAEDILERHKEACQARMSADDKLNAMADLLAGVAVADEATMVTNSMVSAVGDPGGQYACVTSPLKPAPGESQSDGAIQVCFIYTIMPCTLLCFRSYTSLK